MTSSATLSGTRSDASHRSWAVVRRLSILALTLPALLALQFALPTGAQAGQDLYVTVANQTKYPLKLMGNDNDCWYMHDLDPGNAPKIDPATTKQLYTETKSSGSCAFSSSSQNLDLSFQRADGSFPGAYNGALSQANSFPYKAGEGSWDLYWNFASGKYHMRGAPQGFFPINPGQSGKQDAAKTPKGFFCVSFGYVDPTNIKIAVRDDFPGDFRTCAPPSSAKPHRVPGLEPGTAGPGAGGDVNVVYNLFQIGQAACSLTGPLQPWGRTTCDKIGEPGSWDLHNVTADVKDVKPETDARVIGGWEKIAENTCTSPDTNKCELEWHFDYKKGDEYATGTHTGFKVGTKVEFKKHIAIGEVAAGFEFEHDWGSTSEQKHSTEKEVGVASKVEGEPHHRTTMVIKQNKASLTTNFSANLTAGLPGTAQPIGTPATRVLGMSAARNHPCLGYLAGDSGNSLVGLNNYARGQGITPETVGLPDDQRAFLEAAPGFTVSKAEADRCPGFPSGYPAQLAFNGTASFVGSASGPTPDKGTFAPSLPAIATCIYNEPLHGASDSESRRDTAGDDPCKVGTKPPPPNSAGTIVDGNNYGPGSTVHATSGGGSLIKASTDRSLGDQASYVGGPGEDIVEGSRFAEDLRGGGASDILTGGAEDDELEGGAGPDTAHGGQGNDTLSDTTGDNVLQGDAGNDRLTSAASARGGLVGGRGDDLLVMHGSGPVTLIGGKGDDAYRLLEGARAKSVVELPGEGADTIVTDDSLRVPPFVERATAANATNAVTLRAGDEDQTLIGGEGDDTLAGGPGSDRVVGGAGDDEIRLAANGIDLATGGAGADSYQVLNRRLARSNGFRRTAGSAASAHTITDLKASKGDRLVLSTARFGKGLAQMRRHMRVTKGNRARGKGAQFVFNQNRSLLRFDRDGKGGVPAVVVAILEGHDHLPRKAIEIVGR